MLVCNTCRRIAATETSTMRSIEGVTLCARCAEIQANPPLPMGVYMVRAAVAIASGAATAFFALCALALLVLVAMEGPMGQSVKEALGGTGHSWAMPLLFTFIACAALALGLPLFSFYLGAYVASLLWPSSRQRKSSTEHHNA